MKLFDSVREIPITDLEGLRIGNAQDYEAMTGVTVLLFDHGAKAGIDISGGGPASRETPLTSPITADNPLNAIVLSGGSAFGLAASDGVMRYLEEHGIGYETGFAKVPLVCQSCIYDLSIGRSDIRPDAAAGGSQPGEDAVAHFCGGDPQHHKKPGDHAHAGDQLDRCHAVSSFLWINCSSSPWGMPFSMNRRCRLPDISSHFW